MIIHINIIYINIMSVNKEGADAQSNVENSRIRTGTPFKSLIHLVILILKLIRFF